jgi:hypothetical protein
VGSGPAVGSTDVDPGSPPVLLPGPDGLAVAAPELDSIPSHASVSASSDGPPHAAAATANNPLNPTRRHTLGSILARTRRANNGSRPPNASSRAPQADERPRPTSGQSPWEHAIDGSPSVATGSCSSRAVVAGSLREFVAHRAAHRKHVEFGGTHHNQRHDGLRLHRDILGTIGFDRPCRVFDHRRLRSVLQHWRRPARGPGRPVDVGGPRRV